MDHKISITEMPVLISEMWADPRERNRLRFVLTY